jgi:UDP-N-acetylglucosamine pyrophosphorylase
MSQVGLTPLSRFNFWFSHETLPLGQVPSGEVLTYGDYAFSRYEAEGVRQARDAAFVLVAGGLGERLGYSGIKVWSDSITDPPSNSAFK